MLINNASKWYWRDIKWSERRRIIPYKGERTVRSVITLLITFVHLINQQQQQQQQQLWPGQEVAVHVKSVGSENASRELRKTEEFLYRNSNQRSWPNGLISKTARSESRLLSMSSGQLTWNTGGNDSTVSPTLAQEVTQRVYIPDASVRSRYVYIRNRLWSINGTKSLT